MTTKLPEIIPIFPLENILFLPNVNLPLYIFEERYLNMTNDALKTNKIIGMIQIANSNNRIYKELFPIGCAGKIVFYERTTDNKILLILNGLKRFKIKKELSLKSGYRRIIPDWETFKNDNNKLLEKNDKERLLQNIKHNVKTINTKFFEKQLNQISINEIVQIIHEYNIKGIVIGNPINMDGSTGPSSQSVKDFANEFLKKINIPACFWDERLSTVGAFNLSSQLDISVSKRTKNIDKNAAAFILQGAIDYLNN